jgi:hypothetical protein
MTYIKHTTREFLPLIHLKTAACNVEVTVYQSQILLVIVYSCLLCSSESLVAMARQDSLQQHPLSLKIGDTILLYYNAEKRTTEGAQKSGYVIANFSW